MRVFEILHRWAARSAFRDLIDSTGSSPDDVFGELDLPAEGLGRWIYVEFLRSGETWTDYARCLARAYLDMEIRSSTDLTASYVQAAFQFDASSVNWTAMIRDALRHINKAKLHAQVRARIFPQQEGGDRMSNGHRELLDDMDEIHTGILTLWEFPARYEKLAPLHLQLWQASLSGRTSSATELRGRIDRVIDRAIAPGLSDTAQDPDASSDSGSEGAPD